jgi:hypothetical protein
MKWKSNGLWGVFFITFWSTIPCTHLGEKNSLHYASRGISKEDGLVDICVSMLRMLANIVKKLVDAYVDWVELEVTIL